MRDGKHDLRLEVFDASDANRATYEWPEPITVDNLPPEVGDVIITGVPAQGRVLTCGAPVNGQSAQVTYKWLRTAADGSGAEAIDDAAAATYRPSSADAGSKLVCQLTATDNGGSTTERSSVTAPPFANAVVTADPGYSIPAPAVCVKRRARLAGLSALPARAYRKSSITLSGEVKDEAGGLQSGAAVEVQQAVTQSGQTRRSAVATGKTDAQGRFRVRIPRGPSRKLQVVDPSCGALTPTVTQRVRGALSARTSTPRLRNGQSSRFSGRVLGGYLGRGLPLELQVKVAGRWKDVKATVSDRRGIFRVSYRFTRTFVRYSYEFRVVSRAAGAWPFMPAHSATMRVRVN